MKRTFLNRALLMAISLLLVACSAGIDEVEVEEATAPLVSGSG